jgi:hypothetical protein
MLAKLEKIAPAFFEFPAALVEFEQTLLAHAEHEERAVFPLLERGIDEEHRRELADAFRHAAATAPTHAHGHSPESAMGNAVVGPVLATIDRAKDAAHDRRSASSS